MGVKDFYCMFDKHGDCDHDHTVVDFQQIQCRSFPKSRFGAQGGPASKLVKFKLDIVQMVTMNLPSEDSTLIIVMVLSTRWTKSTLIELDRFTLILMTYVWLEHYRELHHTIIIG